MAYGVEIFNASGQTRLDTTTSTGVLVAVGTVNYSGSSTSTITVPDIGGSGTSYAMIAGQSPVINQVASIAMTTQTTVTVTWWSGASVTDFVNYVVYHR